MLLVAVMCSGCLVNGDGNHETAEPQLASEPQLAFARRPFLGVACRSEIKPCGRVGIAVWLPKRARAVSAVLLGQKVRLFTPRPAISGKQGFRRSWKGYAHVAPSRVKPGATLPLDVDVQWKDGSDNSASRSVWLSAGWG
jgi:hypothetical protein